MPMEPSPSTPTSVKPLASIATDIEHEAFAGLRAFLDLAGKVRLDGAAVKWQFVGPVTLGVALHRAGLDRESAFDLALSTVRDRLAALSEVVTDALPNSRQMVVLDEPWFAELMQPGFPIPPDEAIDRMSSAMAALPRDHAHRRALLCAVRRRNAAGVRPERRVAAGGARPGRLGRLPHPVPLRRRASSHGVSSPPTVRFRRRRNDSGGR